MFLAVVVIATAACRRSRLCPPGMQIARKLSTPEAIWCTSPDRHTARWTELYEKSKRRQSCGFRDGKAEGGYTAWHPNGEVWIRGDYRAGAKVGIWSQWSDQGRKTAEGEYREGQLLMGAPVGGFAICEKLVEP